MSSVCEEEGIYVIRIGLYMIYLACNAVSSSVSLTAASMDSDEVMVSWLSAKDMSTGITQFFNTACNIPVIDVLFVQHREGREREVSD